MMMSHEKLEDHFKINFIMTFHHKYSLTELDEMLPWERAIYVALIQNYLKEEKEKQRELEIKKQRSKHGRQPKPTA